MRVPPFGYDEARMASEAPHVPELTGGANVSSGSALGRDEGALPFRLAVARGGLGVELNRPLSLGPLEVSELALALPGLKYPVDLSKGVKQFRTRRGTLQRIVLAGVASAFGEFATERVGEALGEPPIGARLWPVEDVGGDCIGVGLGIFSQSRSVAFDLLWCAADGARAVVDNPRGAGLEAPSLRVALSVLDTLVGSPSPESPAGPTRRGRVLHFGDVPAALARAVLPDFGFRLPATFGLVAAALEVREGRFELSFDVDAEQVAPGRRVLRALESALQLTRADDLLASGRADDARAAYLEVFSLAPGLVVAAHALSDVDLVVAGRQEAALSTLEESGGAEGAGALGAQALVAAGHVERARHALVDTAAREQFGPLSAQLLCRAAQLAESPVERVLWLDRAVARAPNLHSARWLRFEDRVRRADVEGALADAQHLEASSSGAVLRHAVCLRAGRRLAEAGHVEAARRLLEKALRYAPDDSAARAALGSLFAKLGLVGRAATLLQGALGPEDGRAEAAGDGERARVIIELAKVLAESLDDLPQAIARLRQVSARASESAEARALEADYCERLGDLSGASHAYARLREAMDLGWVKGPLAVRALMRGARFEETHGDIATAERHLRVALTHAPHDAELASEYRRMAALSYGERTSSGER